MENVYLRIPIVAEIFVYGDSLQSYNVAVVVPNKDVLLGMASQLGIKKNYEELCDDPKITASVLEEMSQQGRKEGLLGYELAKKIKLHPNSFAGYGIFTSTMKLQRHIAKKAFEKLIVGLYG